MTKKLSDPKFFYQNFPTPCNPHLPLNPNAVPFTNPKPAHPSNPNTTNVNTGSQVPKGKKKSIKNMPPTDQLSFDLEFKTVELNTAKTLILELETTIRNQKQTNFILEERIKLLESSRKKEIHDQYFPPSSSNNSNPAPSSCHPTSGTSTAGTTCQCHQCNHCCSSCLSSARSQFPNDEFKNLVKKVGLISTEVENIRLKLGKIKPDDMAQVPVTGRSVPRSSPTASHGVIEPDPEVASSDDSINTIDENVPQHEHLNFKDLTSQLPQLTQKQPSNLVL